MAEGFFIGDAIMSNPKLLRCSVVARAIYWAMIFECDHEGRERADPIIWIQRASLFGKAAATEEEVDAALAELDRERLAPRYTVAGKAYVFLPGRFEHKGPRKYWRRSEFPLPPPELLQEFPEYTSGLALLTTRSELRHTLRAGESRRYPHLAHQIPESRGQVAGTNGTPVGEMRESSVDHRSLITDEEGGDLPEALEEATGPPPPEASTGPPRSFADATKPKPPERVATPRQRQFAARLLSEHQTSLDDWLRQSGAKVLTDWHVSEIRAQYGGRRVPDGKAGEARRNEAFRALRSELHEGFAKRPDDDWPEWIRFRTADAGCPDLERGLLAALTTLKLHNGEEADVG